MAPAPAGLVNGLQRFFVGVRVANPMQGWERVRWNMNFDEVQRLYPEATEQNGKLVLPDGNPDPEPRHYTISFSFDAGHQLSGITLNFEGSQETGDFKHITDQISTRLGAPIETTAYSATWVRDDTRVSLSKSAQGGLVLSEEV